MKKNRLEDDEILHDDEYEIVEEDIIFEGDVDDDYEYIEVDEDDEVYSDDDYEYEVVEEIEEVEEDDEDGEPEGFYRGQFPPPPPPMPFYFPPPVVPVRNHQFGGSFPPPPPSLRPMLDPALREELDVIQQDEYEEIEIEDNGEEFFIGDDSEDDLPTPAPNYEDVILSAAPLASMKSEASKRMLEIGQQHEAIVKSGKFALFFFSVFKWLASLILVGAMIGACALVVKSYFTPSKNDNQKELVTREAPKGDFTWRMARGRARTCLEDFYKALGLPEDYISANDLLLKGTISTRGNVDEIYCIKKRVSNMVFIKIGSAGTARAYSISDSLFEKPVHRLLEGGMSGSKQELDPKNARIIRVISHFDDLIFARAFSRDFNNASISEDISYEGESEIDGKSYQTLSLKEPDGTVANFYFDTKTSLLYKASYRNEKQFIEVIYSDYKPIDGEQTRPHKRKVFVNSKLYADITFDFIVARDGLIFPN